MAHLSTLYAPVGLVLRLPRLGRLMALWRSRKALAALTPDQLADVGIDPAAAQAEARRAPWDVPAHWRE